MPDRRRKVPRFGEVTTSRPDGSITVDPALTSNQVQRIQGVSQRSSEYQTYIRSAAWRRVRQRYINSRLSMTCAGCGKPWGKGDHLHHRTYKNFGNENLRDLVPLCEPCHVEVHRLYDSDPKWKRRGLWYATRAVTRKQTLLEKKIRRKTLR
jgi:5-methylcytosine-specific restriction endonuclease McrA